VASDRAAEAAEGAPAPAPTEVAGAERRAARTRVRDRAQRDALRERIAAAQRTRLGRDEEPSEPEALGQLSKEYLRQRVREDLIPLAQECYESALEDDEALAGRLTFSFRIVGEPDVGGIVEQAEPTVDSEIQHLELIECMRESMMSMSFDPPENGGTVEVTYPFEFSPEGPPPEGPPPEGAPPPEGPPQ
jgi:hypothetical protein